MLELTLFFDLRTIKGARIVLFVAATGGYKPGREEHAPVAQRIERLTTDQKVRIPSGVRTKPFLSRKGFFVVYQSLQMWQFESPRRVIAGDFAVSIP